MTLRSTFDLLAEATAANKGLPAFNVIHIETAEALAAVAADTGIPLILQISENCAKYHGEFSPIALATLEIARRSSGNLAVHLDHATSTELCKAAIDLGFGSVMYDGAHLPYDENVAQTQAVVAYAHERGVAVEAELGEIGGKDGAHAPGVRTDPQEAQEFATATGVDALAVAVGSSHAMVDRTAALDHELIAKLRQAVPVPLVLHGSSGLPDSEIAAGVRSGMTKINVSTQLVKLFTAGVREFLQDNPTVVDSRKYIDAGRKALTAEAARLAQIIAG
ncbi:class II fructose-bisphosphate aldolase [Canibacter zhoujuaniae]|uniref:class II fructose-bisphosphate aldolase n=1 Tax=Canibacter zhoujuaniae TaxID=2708343 RepID=UPI00141D9117|nr:class II fructose-bisphosphate aldolase [Canibacter zhoujuaniae]